MKQAVNCAVKADRAIRCPICQRGRLLNAAEHTDLRSLRLFRPEQADRAQWFSKCPKCGQQIGIAICPVEVNHLNCNSKTKYYDTSQAHQPPTLECGNAAFGALR